MPDSIFKRTLAGLLLSMLLVGLFYGLLARESDKIVEAQAKAAAEQAKAKSRQKHDADSISTSETKWRQELVTALRKHGQPDEQRVPGTTSAPSQTTATNALTTPTPPAAAATPATGAITAPAAAQSQWDVLWRGPLRWLLPALALLGTAGLVWMGWTVWREREQPLAEPHRSYIDQPLLRSLLNAYAGHIGYILPIPRQVKRFASKARLQNNLLHAVQQAADEKEKAAQQPQPASPPIPPLGFDAPPPPFVFDAAQEILAFLLLLLIEQETSQENRAETALKSSVVPVPLSPRLRNLPEAEFVFRLQELFNNWHSAGLSRSAQLCFTHAVTASKRTSEVSYYELTQRLADPMGQQLLVHLHRFNTGLLV